MDSITPLITKLATARYKKKEHIEQLTTMIKLLITEVENKCLTLENKNLRLTMEVNTYLDTDIDTLTKEIKILQARETELTKKCALLERNFRECYQKLQTYEKDLYENDETTK